MSEQHETRCLRIRQHAANMIDISNKGLHEIVSIVEHLPGMVGDDLILREVGRIAAATRKAIVQEAVLWKTEESDEEQKTPSQKL